MPIKGQKGSKNDTTWPELHINNPPACPAEIWVQLVEHKNHKDKPCPSPNKLFHKKGKFWTSSDRVIILDSGEQDGNGFNFLNLDYMLEFLY